MDTQSKILEIQRNIKRYYQYSQALHHFTNLIAQTTNAKDKIAYYICLDGFATRLSNYCLSLYEEIIAENIAFHKGNSNKIYIRGCLESCLIISILISRPNLTVNFMNNLTYDVVRINNVYKNSSSLRFNLYKEFFNVVLEGKPQKRFGWLPRFKGKKALNMSDLLNYINIESESKKQYYEMLIKSSDNFSHPSFYIPRTVLSNNFDRNILDIEVITNENGIINECIHIIDNFLRNFFETNTNLRIADILAHIVDGNINSSCKPLTFLQTNDYILGVDDTSISSIDVANFFMKRIDIDRKLKMRSTTYPPQISNISNYLSNLGHTILKTKDSYYHKNLGLLLLDAQYRVDDLFKAYYDFDLLSFYTQVRYLIEGIVTINVLTNEDNERNKVYYIHQHIKGYQARTTIKNFLSAETNTKTSTLNKVFEDETTKYHQSIDYIVDYYKKIFSKDVDKNNIVRLNGWALYLNGLDNEYILNLPSLLNFSVNSLTSGINNELQQYGMNIAITDYVLGLYEESCAYSHVTPYAWVNNIKLYKNRNSFKEQFLIILIIFLELFREIDEKLKTDTKTKEIDEINKILDDLHENYENMIIPFINDFIAQRKK